MSKRTWGMGRLCLPRCGCVALAALTVAAVVSACGGHPGPATSTPPTSLVGPSAPATGQAAGPRPAMVAVTTAGALVRLNPATGAAQQTLVPSGVVGDEVSVAANGLVYFTVQSGCTSTIDEVPVAGGTPAVIASGSLPAISPDGTRLAYASQPRLAPQCASDASGTLQSYVLKIRTLSSGATSSLPMVPAGQTSELPAPISHLSWSADNQHLAVSVLGVQDNEGWAVNLVDIAQAHYYFYGPGVTNVPVTGTDAQQSYLREGVYMPNGNLFVSRACCGGDPVVNNSRLMWEVNTSGAFVHQVAIGFVNLDHISLDVSPDGNWLLYLAGNDLYVSQGGARPSELTAGLVAAAWA